MVVLSSGQLPGPASAILFLLCIVMIPGFPDQPLQGLYVSCMSGVSPVLAGKEATAKKPALEGTDAPQ